MKRLTRNSHSFNYSSAARRWIAEPNMLRFPGPRQCGKTTLARVIAAERNARSLRFGEPCRRATARTTDDRAVRSCRASVVVDEAQLRPELAPVLRVLADRRPNPAQFLMLGSASTELIKGTSETLAGRVAFVDMGGIRAGGGGRK